MSGFFNTVEIQEVGRKLVNPLLKRGYHLLAVEQKTWMEVWRPKDQEPGVLRSTPFVRKDLVYCVGRTANQPPLMDALAEIFAEEDGRRRAADERRAAAAAVVEASDGA